MGMTRIQETYHSLTNDYDNQTRELAEQVHNIYTKGLAGDLDGQTQLDQLDPVKKIKNLSARATMSSFVDLVRSAIANQ